MNAAIGRNACARTGAHRGGVNCIARSAISIIAGVLGASDVAVCCIGSLIIGPRSRAFRHAGVGTPAKGPAPTNAREGGVSTGAARAGGARNAGYQTLAALLRCAGYIVGPTFSRAGRGCALTGLAGKVGRGGAKGARDASHTA